MIPTLARHSCEGCQAEPGVGYCDYGNWLCEDCLEDVWDRAMTASEYPEDEILELDE